MSNIIDSIQLSGVTYDLAGSGGVSESAFTAYTAATDTVLANKADLSAATITSTSETSTTGTYYGYKMLSFEYDDGAYLFSATTENDYPFDNFSVTLKDAPNGNTVNIYLNTSTGETDSYILTESEYQSGSRTYTTRTVTTKGNYRITYAYIATDGGGFSYDYGYKTRTVLSKAVSTYIEEDINPALSEKVDSNTYTAYTAATDTALANKQTTLTAGTGINITDNVISATGGGGKAIEAGRGISITTGETADTVSFSLPISAGTGSNSIIGGNSNTVEQSSSIAYGSSNTIKNSFYGSSVAFGKSNTVGGNYCFVCGQNNSSNNTSLGVHIEGENNTAYSSARCAHIEGGYNVVGGSTSYAHSEGFRTSATTNFSHTEGQYTITRNTNEHASGNYNVSNTGSTDADKTLFSVGNGTADNARHNAFEIRQNGDIYISKDGQDVKLQDQLGGGSSYTAGDGIDITNDVISVTGRVETSAITTSITSSSTDAQVPSAKAVNDKLGGFTLVQVTQQQYDALATKDPNTLYIIVN